MKLLDQQNLTTIAMMAIFSVAILLSLSLPTKAAAMPLVVGIPGLLMCTAQLLIDNFRKGKTPPEEDGPDSIEDDGSIGELAMFVWVGLFAAALLGFGFLIGGPLIVTAFVGVNYRENARHAIIAGLGTFAVLYGVFQVLLGLQLFEGFIPAALFG